MIRAIVVMGPSGCGKSTLGLALARALDWCFIEGDALHPPANIAKMAAGIALTDEDRRAFLENVGGAILAARGEGAVVACSALKRSYRDRIRALAGEVAFVLPLVDRTHLMTRLAARRDHFMPASLLDSQLEILEPPTADERALILDGAASPDAQVQAVLAAATSLLQ